MNLHLFVKRFCVAGLAAFSFAASAAPLSGSVSSVGTMCLGSGPGQPTCSAQDVSTLRYFDYINGGMGGLNPSPGAPGSLTFLTALGGLEPVIGRSGLINDFAIPGPGDPLSTFVPVAPLWTVSGSDGATYTYVLSALTSIDRSVPSSLDVRGTGDLCRNGADCSPFSFIFTTQNAAGAIRTTFSASQSGGGAVVKVAEPASLALLGLGFVGLVAGARRRRRS